jgi:hypothetical protein
MTVEEAARFRRSLGDGITMAGGVIWRQVRPFFYRPLLPFKEYPTGSVKGPGLASLGGFQHAVPPLAPANSTLNLIMCNDLNSYSLASLDRHERREIKRANEALTISIVEDVNHLKSQAYPVYLSFYERTGYQYKSDRRRKENFDKWVEALFAHPKVVVLAAHDQNHELGAVGVWYLVESTLVYSTFFCNARSLKLHVTGLMLHNVREAVAARPDITQIYVGNFKYSAAKGIDDFYLKRGCVLVQKPAWLHLNPVTETGLKRFAPEQYSRLVGAIPGQGEGPAVASDRSSLKPANGAAAGDSKANS